MNPRIRQILERRPWIGLLVAAPVCLLLLGFAVAQYRYARALGNEPRRMTLEDALSASEGGAEPWVELADAHFECASSIASSGSRYGWLTVGERRVPAIASISGSACPAEDTPLVGVLERIQERVAGRLARDGLSGVEGREAILFTHAGPANSRTGAVVLAVLAACCAFVGGIGYVIRRYAERVERSTSAEQRRAVTVALERPPLRLRPAYVLKSLSGAVVMGAFVLFWLALAIASSVWIAQIAREQSRFNEARDVRTIAAPAVEVDARLPLAPSLFPTVTIAWQSSTANEEWVSYYPLWTGAVKRPIVVRSDALGPLTSAGLELRNWRIAMWGLAIVFAMIAAWFSLHWLVQLRRRWRALQRATEAPELVFLPLVATELKRQNGIPVGMLCRVRDAQGKLHSAYFSVDRPPLRNAVGDELLAVLARGEPNAEPLIVAEDGYPFLIDAL